MSIVLFLPPRYQSLIALLFFFLVASIFIYQPNAKAQSRFGLWVEAEGQTQAFKDSHAFVEFSEFVEAVPLTDLYCQVYRRGRSWFPSMLADDLPYRESLSEGVEPLRAAIDFAHSKGKKVHAWVNVLRVKDRRNAPIFKIIGKEAALVDSFGSSLFDYDLKGLPPANSGSAYGLDTPGIWLDPTSERVRQYVAELILELVRAYPDLDGIHLDMIRFPFAVNSGNNPQGSRFLEFGYSQDSIRSFFDVLSGMGGYPREFFAKRPSGREWEYWRAAHVTQLVREIKSLLASVAPHMELSVAALADSERAKKRALQDWPQWLERKLVDKVVLMAYTTDASLVEQQTLFATKLSEPSRVMIGLGAWLMLRDQELLIRQVRKVRATKAGGVVLFSYSNLASKVGRLLTAKVAEVVSEGQ
ncbi:MAG: family 10 glycosylhydrolase [Deltaproteobacteria bacterium]|nr:family 10 glycosylhydrolase [Deltaproteobacteria bacterium]